MTKLLRNDPNFAGSINDVKFNFGTEHHHTEMMRSNAEFQKLIPSYRSDLPAMFEGRLHQIMGWSSHTVDDWQA